MKVETKSGGSEKSIVRVSSEYMRGDQAPATSKKGKKHLKRIFVSETRKKKTSPSTYDHWNYYWSSVG